MLLLKKNKVMLHICYSFHSKCHLASCTNKMECFNFKSGHATRVVKKVHWSIVTITVFILSGAYEPLKAAKEHETYTVRRVPS